jgi:hypothetical protein
MQENSGSLVLEDVRNLEVDCLEKVPLLVNLI